LLGSNSLRLASDLLGDRLLLRNARCLALSSTGLSCFDDLPAGLVTRLSLRVVGPGRCAEFLK
jgi:hypothetical protein